MENETNLSASERAYRACVRFVVDERFEGTTLESLEQLLDEGRNAPRTYLASDYAQAYMQEKGLQFIPYGFRVVEAGQVPANMTTREEMVRYIVDRRQQGKSMPQIAAELNVHYTCVRGLLRSPFARAYMRGRGLCLLDRGTRVVAADRRKYQLTTED